MHLHRSFPTTLPLARTGVCLQSTPAAEPQMSRTILTGADWCAVWNVARNELGLLLLSTLWKRECACSGEVGVLELQSNKLLLSRQQVFPDHLDRCANAAVEKERSATAETLCGFTQWDHRVHAAWRLATWTTTRLPWTRCRFSRISCCRN